MVAGMDPVITAEQAIEAGMGDTDVQPIRIIVGDVLPVDLARSNRHSAERLQGFETIWGDLAFERRHHVGDGSAGADPVAALRPLPVPGWLEPDEHEAAPYFH